MNGLSTTHWRLSWGERAREWLGEQLAAGADWRYVAALYAAIALLAVERLS